jgi:NAD(P)-dependent dehydrogenase (short-subunit alcohol dehydrogenase family)
MSKNILIAGASRGLGRALLNHLSIGTEKVRGCSRSIDKSILRTDITKYEEVDRLFTFIEHVDSKPVTHLVITAGVYGPLESFYNLDINDWKKAIDINLFGPANLCYRAIPKMIDNNYGKIIILSGGGATRPMKGCSSYGASKAGLVRFAETLAHELYKYNIDVNCVAPGAMNTEFLEQALEAGPESIGQEFYDQCVAQKQNGGVDFSVPISLIEYLLSSDSDGVSGKLIAAVWDDWKKTPKGLSDIYTLRRTT